MISATNWFSFRYKCHNILQQNKKKIACNFVQIKSYQYIMILVITDEIFKEFLLQY